MSSELDALLHSREAGDRKQAIKQLAHLGSMEALKRLVALSKNDENADVRELALKAVRYVKNQQSKEMPSVAANSIPDIQPPQVVVEPIENNEPQVVSEARQKQAKDLIERALGLSLKDEKSKATDSVIKAFTLDPNLRNDSYSLKIAMNVTGLDAEGIFELVKSGGDKRKGQKTKADSFSWTSPETLKAVGYTLVCFCLFMGFVVFVSGYVITALQTGYDVYQSGWCEDRCSPEQLAFLEKRMTALSPYRQMTQSNYIPFAAVLSAITIGLALLFGSLVHIIAKALYGEGTLLNSLEMVMTGFGAFVLLCFAAMLYFVTYSYRWFHPSVIVADGNIAGSNSAQLMIVFCFVIPAGCAAWANETAKANKFGFVMGAAVSLLALVPTILLGFFIYQQILGPFLSAMIL